MFFDIYLIPNTRNSGCYDGDDAIAMNVSADDVGDIVAQHVNGLGNAHLIVIASPM